MKKHLQPSLASIQLRLRRTSLHPLFLLLSLIFFLLSSSALAEIRYVSKTGSSTPPYTSWETAADSIQKCINISQFGDTIYVANGVYKEHIVMIRGLALIGAGIDSCTIDTRSLQEFESVIVRDSCLLKSFKIIASNYNPQTQQWDAHGVLVWESGVSPDYFSIVEFNDISNCYYALVSSTSNTVFSRNLIRNTLIGINLGSVNSGIVNKVIENSIESVGTSIKIDFGGTPYIANNICIGRGGFSGSASGLNEIYNNLFINKGGTCVAFSDNTLFYNNVITGYSEEGMLIGGDNQFIKNNIIENAEVGLTSNTPGTPTVQYNNFWNVETINHNTAYPDSTNLFRDPMFVNDDSTKGELDFHLQMFSPLIDAGDPNILDKDGSRSDIGLFGGPNREKYTYRDLAPKPPSNLTAQYDSGLVKLTWNRNTEADFFHYRVYRDTVPDFMYDTTKIIAVLPDTIYYDELPEIYLAGNYYYKVTALDSTGHQSAPGEEVHINITGIPEGPPVVVEHYQLLNNYPNPFNPSTIIPYRLKEPGYVKLYVYDIKGELVRVLVNEYQNSGYYEVVFRPTTGERKQVETGEEYWTGYNDDIASGMYIYQLMVKGEGNIPVFTGMGKMILLK